MCWLCEAKHISYKRWGPNDRKAGLDKAKFVERVQNMRKELCPFWEWPELIPSDLCLPDWLHAVDQGIGADIAGQILVELADSYLLGPSRVGWLCSGRKSRGCTKS